MTDFERALRRASERLYAVHGLITPALKETMKEMIKGGLHMSGYRNAEVELTLNDADETAQVIARHEGKTESVTLRWEDSEGIAYARIDTDGDGR